MRRQITLLLLLSGSAMASWQNGYQFRRTITVNRGQVPSTQNNFTVLVPLSLGAGKVQHTVTVNSGICPADLIFTSDAAGISPLAWECEPWNAESGSGSLWVQFPSVFDGAIVYVFYGNPSITTWQGNTTGAWDNHYKLILHFPDGATTLSPSDSTGLNRPSSSNAMYAAGEIDGGAAFNGSTSHITVPSTPSLKVWTGDFTVSVWFYMNSLTYYETLVDTAGRELYFSINTPTSGYASFGEAQGAWSGGSGWTPDTWHYFVATRAGNSNVKIYLDGWLQASVTPYGGGSNDSGSDLVIGTNPSTGGTAWNGKEDEFRLSNTSRSADWIAAEYNNQWNPSAFLTVSAETTRLTGVTGTLLIGEVE